MVIHLNSYPLVLLLVGLIFFKMKLLKKYNYE